MNSLYSFPYISFIAYSENLVLNQQIAELTIIFLVTYVLENVANLLGELRFGSFRGYSKSCNLLSSNAKSSTASQQVGCEYYAILHEYKGWI